MTAGIVTKLASPPELPLELVVVVLVLFVVSVLLCVTTPKLVGEGRFPNNEKRAVSVVLESCWA